MCNLIFVTFYRKILVIYMFLPSSVQAPAQLDWLALFSVYTPDKQWHHPDKQWHHPDKQWHRPDKQWHHPDKQWHHPDKQWHHQESL